MAWGTPEHPHRDEFVWLPAPHSAGAVVLRVIGDVDVYSAARLRAALEPVLADGAAAGVLLECAQLDFIDSTGLGVLIAAAKRLREREAILTLRAVPERLMKIFRITGLTHVFAFQDAPDAAGAPR